MDPTPSLLKGLLRRASALRRGYGYIPGGPEDTQSLALRAAAKFPKGGLPNAETRDHLYAIWTKALESVLNDSRRRQRTAERHGYRYPVPLEENDLRVDPRERVILGHMKRALEELARLDAETGERKACILTLRYLDGLKWREIAAELGSSVTTVRREAQFAAAWMRDRLKQKGVRIDNLA